MAFANFQVISEIAASSELPLAGEV